METRRASKRLSAALEFSSEPAKVTAVEQR